MHFITSLFGHESGPNEQPFTGELGWECLNVMKITDDGVPIGEKVITNMYPGLTDEAKQEAERVYETFKDTRAAGATAVEQVRRTEQIAPAAELAVAEVERNSATVYPAQPQSTVTLANPDANGALNTQSVYDELYRAYGRAA